MKHSDFASYSVYHRSTVDQSLIEDLLELVENLFRSLAPQANWSITLYLLYSQTDSRAFGSWEIRRELKKCLVEHHVNEVQTLSDLGDGRSTDRQALETLGYTLALPSSESPIQCRLKGYDSSASLNPGSVDLDMYVAEDQSFITAKGRLTALVQILPIVRDQEMIYGGIECDGNIAISPHVDVSQRGARGGRRVLYLTQPETSFSLGPHVGCDLYAPSIDKVLVLTAKNNKLTLDQHSRVLNQVNEKECRGSDFHLAYSTSSDLGAGRDLGQVLNEREATENVHLEVVARVLPRRKGDGPNGYGLDWCELSSQVSREVKVSIRLDGKSTLAVDSEDCVFVLLNAQRTIMEVGDAGMIFKVNERKYRWEPDVSGIFYGSLFFEDDDAHSAEARLTSFPPDQEATGIVARGIHSELLSLLVNYTEDELISRRGSIVFHSNGRGRIEVSVVNKVGGGQLFVHTNDSWRSLQQSTVILEGFNVVEREEFVFGSSRYRLTRKGKAYRKVLHWTGTFDLIRKN
ncbi:MAG: hypothetical protein ACREBG_23250 [Pyrinomonadaceae bacterium]